MNSCIRFFSLLIVSLFSLNACLVSEAPKVISKNLHVYFDCYKKEDKKWIRSFEKRNKVKVIIHLTNLRELKTELKHRPFDGKIDVLFTQSDSSKSLIRSLKNYSTCLQNSDFDNLPKQFNNSHHRWLPLCHNPLVLSINKDTNSTCVHLNFSNWAKKNDSLIPQFNSSNLSLEHLNSLKKSVAFSYFLKRGFKISPKQKVELLSEVVAARNRKECFYFLVDKRKYLTQTVWLFCPKYSRNQSLARKFVSYALSRIETFSSNRNQLPTFKKVPVSIKISKLNFN